jgi:hypothetical protein
MLALGATVPAASARAKPAHVPAQQLGFNSYVQDLCQSDAEWASDATGQFTELKSLGANAIALAFSIYMPGVYSNTVSAQRTCGSIYQTPSPARLAVAINAAHALGLTVFLRPLVEETTLVKTPGGWRGMIRPTNVKLWFNSYLATITPYLKLAQQLKVEYFAISTELDSLSKKPEWPSVIKAAKKYYKGPLVFTVPWHPGQVAHAGTSPGFDAYEGINATNNATPAQLLAIWNHDLKTSDRLPFPISTASMDEVAIPAQDGAYTTPWVYSLPLNTNPFNQSIQANWYSMACSFFKEHNLRGIYYWGVWYANGAQAVLTTPGPTLTQEIQPESVTVIKECYTGHS